MRLYSHISQLNISAIILIIVCFTWLSNHPALLSTPYCIELLEGSSLSLHGKSNINSFSCDCETINQLPPQNLYIVFEDDAVFFKDAELNIETKSLDCGFRGINQDLYKSLAADQHPYISLVLDEAQVPSVQLPVLTNEWVPVHLCAWLTVAGTKRKVNLDIKARKINKQTYRFQGVHRIKMTDYAIAPPTAMFGAIKVNNEIAINLDLLVEKQ